MCSSLSVVSVYFCFVSVFVANYRFFLFFVEQASPLLRLHVEQDEEDRVRL